MVQRISVCLGGFPQAIRKSSTCVCEVASGPSGPCRWLRPCSSLHSTNPAGFGHFLTVLVPSTSRRLNQLLPTLAFAPGGGFLLWHPQQPQSLNAIRLSIKHVVVPAVLSCCWERHEEGVSRPRGCICPDVALVLLTYTTNLAL